MLSRIPALTVLCAATGCAAPCGPPAALLDGEWAVFGNVIAADTLGTLAPPDVYPVNGATLWTFRWEALGAPILTVDGQDIQTTGSWDPTRCGAFTLTLDGVYTSPEGVRHIFEADGALQTWDDQLVGELKWSGRWNFGERSGLLEVERAAISGERRVP